MLIYCGEKVILTDLGADFCVGLLGEQDFRSYWMMTSDVLIRKKILQL